MSSTFFGLELGFRSLTASQTELAVISNNTANINTPGYSRQVVNLTETDPYTTPTGSRTTPGQLGTGVTVSSITRVRDQFVDQRVWAGNADQGALANLKDTIGQVESAYNEPGASGLSQQITNFFNSFSDLSANPSSLAIRSTVLNTAVSLTNQFHSVSAALSQVGPQITDKINVKVNDINTLAQQIAALNGQIRLSVAAGDNPNDLQDKRSALLDQLSGLADIQVVNTTNAQTQTTSGSVNIYIGGYALVQDSTSNTLPSTVTTANNEIGLVTKDGVTIPLRSGEVYGLIKAATLVQGYQKDLDTVASSLVTAVNNIHQNGYALDGTTNNNFFTTPPANGPGAAASISVDPALAANLNKIAAATPPTPPNPINPGNGDNARQIAALVSAPVINGFSIDAYYNSRVALIGSDSQTFQAQAQNQDKVVSQLKNQQSSVSGVNLDEELTHMLQYQRTYQAAARFINVADSFLNAVINGLGAGSAPTG